MMAVAVALLFAATLYPIGRWGHRNAASLVPMGYSADGKRDKERVLRRGSLACQVVAVACLLIAIAELVAWAVEG
jgi:hypothetical protein